MKFKFIITNLSGGGAERVLLTLAKALVDHNHDVEIIIFENLICYEIYQGIKVTVLTEKLSRGWIGKRITALRLRRYIAQSDKDKLIISALPFSNEVACLANLENHWCRIDNTLGAEINKLSINKPRKAKRRQSRYVRMYNKRPLIAISDGMIDDLRAIGITSKIVKIYNPFDIKHILFASKQKDVNIPNQPYIVHVGRFNSQKRHDILLDAWKLADLKEYLLVLLTPANNELQKMIIDKGLSNGVRIVGFKQNPYPWIYNSDLMVLSSDHEGFGNVIVESLICNTPVVSTDCQSGPAEILSDVPESLTPVGDVKKLSNKIIEFTNTPPDLSRINLSKYDVNHIIKVYENLIRSDFEEK